MKAIVKKVITSSIVLGLASGIVGCGSEKPQAMGISPQVYTDSLFAVMKADRTNYTKLIIKRLGPAGVDAIKPNEHWEDMSNGAPLPAQMFRFGAELVTDMTDKFTYSLQSTWPVNKQNAPKTAMEKEGLAYIVANPGKNFYGTEKLGDLNYYTAIYPDVAVATPCIDCHNQHKDTPKTDFKLGDVMGGVVIRVPM